MTAGDVIVRVVGDGRHEISVATSHASSVVVLRHDGNRENALHRAWTEVRPGCRVLLYAQPNSERYEAIDPASIQWTFFAMCPQLHEVACTVSLRQFRAAPRPELRCIHCGTFHLSPQESERLRHYLETRAAK